MLNVPRTAVGSPIPAMKRMRELLRPFLRDSECSFIFFVYDPTWPEEPLRLVNMSRIHHPEPLYGIFNPETLKLHVVPRQEISYFPYAEKAPRSHRADAWSAVIQQIPLFGDFVTRESVRSYCRLAWFSADSAPRGLLFINYRSQRHFPPSFESSLRDLHHAVSTSGLCDIANYGDSQSDHVYAPPVINPFATLLTQNAPTPRDRNSAYASILRHLLSLCGHTEENARASLYFVDPQSNANLLGAISLGVHADRSPARISIPAATSLEAWVAIRQRSLLISQVAHSGFRDFLAEPYTRAFDCFLVAPILVAGEFVGIVKLELRAKSTHHPCKQYLHALRMMPYVGRQLAMLWKLESKDRDISLLSELFDITSQPSGWLTSAPSLDSRRDRLADVATTIAGADGCTLWYYRPTGSFIRVAAKHDAEREPIGVRQGGGWTDWITLSQMPLLLARAKPRSSNWQVSRWDDELARWRAISPDSTEWRPISEVSTSGSYCRLLGVPLMTASGTCCGAAWFNYRDRLNFGPLTLQEIRHCCRFIAAMVLRTETEARVREDELSQRLAVVLRFLRHEAMTDYNARIQEIVVRAKTPERLWHHRSELEELVNYQEWMMNYYLSLWHDNRRLRVQCMSHDIFPLVEKAIRMVGSTRPTPGCQITDCRLRKIPIICDEAATVTVLVNLISNAKKHGRHEDNVRKRDETIRVILRSAQDGGQPAVTVEVDDGGPGFPAELANVVGTRMLTGEPACGKRAGAGLGLYTGRLHLARRGDLS